MQKHMQKRDPSICISMVFEYIYSRISELIFFSYVKKKKKSRADINTDFHFTFFSLKALFKAVSLFALALKSLLFERALRREGKTFTECSKNQSITYNTVSCSL